MDSGDLHERSGPRGGHGPHPDEVLDRLDALERTLHAVEQELAATRRTLSELLPDSAADLAASSPTVTAGRASMRRSGLGVLFRSAFEDGPGSEPATAEPPHAGEGRLSGPASSPAAAEPSPDSWIDDRAGEVEPQRAAMVANRELLLGPEHPDTLWAIHDLALALADAGEIPTAWRLATRLLEVRARTLGSEHPFTARASELQLAIAGLSDRAATA